MPSSNRFRHHRSALALAVCAVLWPLSVCASPTGNINLDAINAAGAYAQGFTGAGVRIGILDSGFDTTHLAFEGKDIIKLYSDQYLEKFGTGVDATQQSHGSHVAGIASGNSSVNYGVAKDASLLLLYSTIQGPTMIYEVADLYKKAIETYDDVKIYSNSWGWVRGFFSYGDIPDETKAFNEVFNSAVEHDKLMVFAAGNQGGLAPADPILPIMRDPSKAGHFINVINIESDHLFEEGFVHGNSSAIEASNRALFASLWSVAAPGTNIVSVEAGSGNGSIEMTGTSMAAPHVAGTLALVQQAFPWMTVSQLADCVLTTARKPQEGVYEVLALHQNKQARTQTITTRTITCSTAADWTFVSPRPRGHRTKTNTSPTSTKNPPPLSFGAVPAPSLVTLMLSRQKPPNGQLLSGARKSSTATNGNLTLTPILRR